LWPDHQEALRVADDTGRKYGAEPPFHRDSLQQETLALKRIQIQSWDAAHWHAADCSTAKEVQNSLGEASYPERCDEPF